MDILKIEDLSFKYPTAYAPALDSIDLSVREGEFCVLCGTTGSGKSTLLRLLKREIAPLGELKGRILYRNVQIDQLDSASSACAIGFVMQDPEQQIVCDKVSHELAFGLENLGIPQEEIARRVCEMASYFGIEEWFDKRVYELSGGQKQLLNLAAVMVMDPDILVLDEPTSQLDPIAATEFINTLKKINRDLSLTVLIAEHRLEELIPVCDRLIVLEDGKLSLNGKPGMVVGKIKTRNALLCAMPASVRLFCALGGVGQAPLTVRDGRKWLETRFNNAIRSLAKKESIHHAGVALSFKNVFFRYQKDLPDVSNDLSFTVYEGEIFCILGGNGSGKSTCLSLAGGLLQPYSGTIRVFGKKLKEYKDNSLYRGTLSILPQDVGTVFLANTVREELADVGADLSLIPFDVSQLLDMHPYDLSGGERQLVALAKVLACKPRLLLADEPTKGIDAEKKKVLAELLKKLKADGVTVVIVTHDVEFAAICADRCALFFRGNIVSDGAPDEFFAQNRFYTTAAHRISKAHYDGAVTVEAVEALCRLNRRAEGGEGC